MIHWKSTMKIHVRTEEIDNRNQMVPTEDVMNGTTLLT